MADFAGAKPQATVTFNYWESEIAAYIKDKKLEKVVLIGHSMGGGLALALAADYPQLISKIIVVDAVPCLSALMNPSFKSKENNDCSNSVKQITAMSDEQFYQMQRKSIPQLLADTSRYESVIGWSVKSDRKTFAEMYCDFSNTDLREKITSITCPSLILLEAYFVNIKPLIEGQYKNLKTTNLQYANKGMHFIMYDDQDWYFSQLNAFISEK
jgi:pimeloyl-ACP methyl ester carboxylesterase